MRLEERSLRMLAPKEAVPRPSVCVGNGKRLTAVETKLSQLSGRRSAIGDLRSRAQLALKQADVFLTQTAQPLCKV